MPLWVVLSAHTAIGLGTLTGGWRIVKTMGSKITRLQPVGGVAAESAAAATLFFTSLRRASRCRPPTPSPAPSSASVRAAGCRPCAGAWPARVVWAWVLTIPGAWLIATVTYAIVAMFS